MIACGSVMPPPLPVGDPPSPAGDGVTISNNAATAKTGMGRRLRGAVMMVGFMGLEWVKGLGRERDEVD